MCSSDLSFDTSDGANEKYVLDEIYKGVGLTLGQFEEIEKVELLLEGKMIQESSIPAFANEY